MNCEEPIFSGSIETVETTPMVMSILRKNVVSFQRNYQLTLRPLEVVESVTIVVPGLSRNTTVAMNAMRRLRLIASPSLSTTPLLSTSVSRTMPRSAPTSVTACTVGTIASGSCSSAITESIVAHKLNRAGK